MTATNPANIQLNTKEGILKPDTKLIKDLISEGREKGFITLDDINNHLGDDPVSSEQMEQIFSIFLSLSNSLFSGVFCVLIGFCDCIPGHTL